MQSLMVLVVDRLSACLDIQQQAVRKPLVWDRWRTGEWLCQQEAQDLGAIRQPRGRDDC